MSNFIQDRNYKTTHYGNQQHFKVTGAEKEFFKI